MILTFSLLNNIEDIMYLMITMSIFMFSLYMFCTCAKLNFTRLMGIYINSCGERGLCKDWPGLTGYEYSMPSRCPPCFCEDDCIQINRCCPDKFFEGKLTRFRDAVFQGSLKNKHLEPPKYHVVDTCPDFAENLDRCQNPAYTIKDRAFVTSLVSNYTYYNIHCALCNGEKKSDLLEWDISLDRDGSFLQFVDSNDVFERLIKEYNSFVSFIPPASLNDILIPFYLRDDEYITEICPGDEDLHLACSSSYVNEIRLFRNVFCYLCKLKSIKRVQNFINTCPKSVSKTIQKLCQDNPVSNLTYPYRNFYCFACNIPTSKDTGNLPHLNDEAKRYVFPHLSSDVDESFEDRDIMLTGRRLYFYNNEFNEKSLINKIINAKPTENLTTDPANSTGNITDQFEPFLFEMAAAYPHRICDRTILPKNTKNITLRNCDCSFACLFKNPCSCCLDTTLLHPTGCVSNARAVFSSYISNKEVTTVQVISVCYERRINAANIINQQKIKRLCEGELDDFDLFVLSKGVTYKNVFCFLCNTNYTITNNSLVMDPYRIFDISIACDSLLQFDFLIHFSQVFEQAIMNKCDVTYNFKDAVTCSTEKMKTTGAINECKTSDEKVKTNKVEKWEYKNKSHMPSLTACRNKHELCKLCMSSNSLELWDKAVVCTKSNTKQVFYKDACLSLPIEQYHDLVYPYRNVFCSYCMDEYKESYSKSSSEECVIILEDYRAQRPVQLMRDLFVPTMTFRASSLQVKSKSLDHVCFPGRVLSEGTCKPIIASPNFMKYAQHVRCSLIISSLMNDTELVLTKVRSAVFKVISNSSLVYGCEVQEFYLLARPQEIKVYQQGIFHFELQATLHSFLLCINNIKPFLRETVERFLLQTPQLLKINNTLDGPERISFVLKGINFCNISKTLTQSELIPENDFHSLKKSYQFAVISRPYDGIIVSPLLLCTQRVINVHDVHFDFKHYRTVVNDTREVFHLGEYVLDYNDKIRVCIKNQFVPLKATGISEILETLTNILNAISTLSLVLLFVIYLKFPALRTIPGLNVMSTTFSLVCMQLTYTIANVLHNGTLSCQISGVLLHYFWLCLCCCLFICCYHMFITFRSLGNLIHDGNVSKILLKYRTFSYMFPFVAVSTNVMLSYFFEGSIGYGTRVCFVERFIQNTVTFIVPLLLTCVCNTIMYILTVLNINLDKNLQKSRENRSELVIFTKLFCLTGSVWILQIIDSFLQISFFSFAVTMLTSSQGFFLFLSFSSSSYIKKLFKSRKKDKSKRHHQNESNYR